MYSAKVSRDDTSSRGRAQQIANDIEREIREGTIRPGERLPTVRTFAANAGKSPGTVASAYRLLRDRGFVLTEGRRGTRVAVQPGTRPSRPRRLPEGVRNLASAAIDPNMAPDMSAALLRLAARHPKASLYEENAKLEVLVDYATAEMGRAGVAVGSLSFVNGTLDGIERVLEAHLRPGDRVGVEDPALPRLLDLLRALSLQAVPVPVDDDGPDPERLDHALKNGLDALVVTPAGQNPFGSRFSDERAKAVRRLIASRDVLLIEDAHGWERTPAPVTATGSQNRWAVIRSMTRLLGSDLRLAFLAGDRATVSRVEARQAITTSWVSRLLQEVAADMLTDATVRRQLDSTAIETNRRREALLAALERLGVAAHGRSGLFAWIPVREEAFAVRHLLDVGYAVQPGERFRLTTPPAIRVTAAHVQRAEVDRLAESLAEAATSQTLIT